MSFFGTNSIPETPLLAYLFYRDSSDAQNQQKSTLENIQDLFSFPKRLWGPTERARDTTQGFLSFEYRFANRGQRWDALYKPQLEEALAALNDFCCLHNDHDGSFRMYLQVQLSVQERLQDPRNLEALPHLEHAVMCVSAILPDVAEVISMLDQTDCGNLYHHFRSLEKNVVELFPKSCDAKLACASFRYKYGLYCLSYGLKKCCQSWDQVEDMFRTSAEIYQEVLGERHPRTLKARHQAELTQIERQKDIGARAELDKIRDLVCDQSNAFPGALWDDIMWGDRIMLNITYRHYENWVIAAREFAMALKELGRLHGHDSDQELRILQRMVVFYRLWMQSGEINGWTNVRDAFRAIDTSDILSKNDSFKARRDAPSIKVLWQFSKNVYCIQPGNTAVIDMPREPVSSVLPEWKRLAQDVFDRYKHRHGEDHPDTLRSLTELTIAESYQAFGVAASRPFEMAEDCHRLQVNILGESHRDTPGTKRLVGEILHKAGRSAEAVQVLRECYDSLVHNFKETSNLTLECAFSLAETYLSVGRFGRPKDADDLKEQMIKVREVVFKAKNDWKPHGLCFALELSAILQRRQGRFGEAMEILERILEVCRYADPSYPPQHDKPFEYEVKIRYSIAVCYFQDGNWEEEEKRGLTVLEQRRKWEVDRIFYGKNHVDTLRSLFLVALARWNLGWCDEARSMMRECWVGAKGRLGVEHKLSRQALSQLVEYMKRGVEEDEEAGEELGEYTPETEEETPPKYVEFPCRRRDYHRRGNKKSSQSIAFIDKIMASKTC